MPSAAAAPIVRCGRGAGDRLTPPTPENRILALSLPGGGARGDAALSALARGALDWPRIVADADRLGALALLGAALSAAGVEPPVEATRACRGALVQGTLRDLIAGRILGEILRALRDRGVDAFVLKGSPLGHELYDNPGLRPLGDIDLLVRRRDRETAIDALATAGYRLPLGSLPLRFFLRHHFHVTLVRPGAEGLPIELHWATQPVFSLSRIPEDQFWARPRAVACGAGMVGVPGREETFLYLAQHLVRHLLVFDDETACDPVAALLEPTRRGRLAWIADLVLLCVRPPGLEWDLVDRKAAEWGLARDLAGVRRFLAERGVAPPGPDDGPGAAGGRRLRIVRAIGALLPASARASGAFQLRPVLALDLLRFAFPGMPWIRWRYQPRTAVAAVISAATHAVWVIGRALRLGLAVVTGGVFRGRGRTYTGDAVTGAAP